MDYYKRKKLAQMLVKKMLKDGYDDKDIMLSVDDTYQMSPNWTEKYLTLLRGG